LAACGDDAVILEKICQALQSHLPEQMKSVRNAMDDETPQRLREAAHKICGILAAFSTTAAAVASNIEDLSASGQLEECRPLVEKLDTMACEITRQLSGLTIENLRQQTVAV
jgi:two-component system, sensor histidine kinase and response regulator